MKETVIFYLFCATLLIFVVVIFGHENQAGSGKLSHHLWTCRNNKCQKFNYLADSNSSSLETCNMECSDLPPLWPKPKRIEIINKQSSTFLKEHIFLKIHCPEGIKGSLEQVANIFLENLATVEISFHSKQYQLYEGEVTTIRIALHVLEDNLNPSSTVNENYTLFSQRHHLDNSILVNIFADSYFGARHGLETLNQLIWFDTVSDRFRILHDVKIVDGPSFSHRGLLVDVSRHYFPTDLLKKVIDGMAASKLNVLHLHVSDSASFPLMLPSNQQLALNGAYDDSSRYSAEDIKNLVDYGKKRGVRTIMEVDAPSHISPEAWSKDQVLCDNPDIFKTTLNPDNPESLNTLETIYKDLFQLGTDKETFHIGDDEVVTSCWTETDSAISKNNNVYSVWTDFTNEMMKRVKSANNGTIPKNIVLWSSPLTDRYINSLSFQEDLVIQYWFGEFRHILEYGYKIIFSTVGHWYLDCGFGPWKKSEQNGACDPYTDWRKFYKYRPWKDYSTRLDQVLGGEVCLWSEQVSPDDLETRLWPRAAAFAERVWSDPEIMDQDDVFRRIDFHSRRLRKRGFRVAAIWPEICSLYPDKC